MEKRNYEEFSMQYEAVKTGFASTHTFTYRVNGSKDNTLQINILNIIPMYLSYDILNGVKEFIEIDNEINIYSLKSVLAKEFLEICTDAPLPLVMDNEIGDLICDYNLCYELVFGKYGIAKYDRMSIDFLNEMLGNLQEFYTLKIKGYDAVNQLSQKLLDLYELFKYELDDMLENPANILQVLEQIIPFATSEQQEGK